MLPNELFNNLSKQEQDKILDLAGKIISINDSGLYKCFVCKIKFNKRDKAVNDYFNNIQSYYEMATCCKECEEYLRLLLC